MSNTKATKKADKVAGSQLPCVYMGPNIPGGILSGTLFHGSIFKCEVEKLAHLEESFDKVPELKKLFVVADGDYPRFKADLQREGTAAHHLYTVAAQKIQTEMAAVFKKGGKNGS